MQLLEINKAWGVNDTPNDVRHYEQEVNQYYFEFFALKLLESYLDSNTLEVTPHSTEKEVVAFPTHYEEGEYSYTHEFRSSDVYEFENDAFLLEVVLDGEVSEDRNINTLEVVRVEITFNTYCMDIQGNEQINNLILDNLNITE